MLLPFQYYTLAPLFKDKLRLFAMKDNKIGEGSMDGDGYLDRLNQFSTNLQNEDIWNSYRNIRDRDYPIMGEPSTLGKPSIKDLLVNDNFTQNALIREIYRKNKVNDMDLKPISHGNVKYVMSMYRGIDKTILKTFLNLDDEFSNRKNIQPLLI